MMMKNIMQEWKVRYSEFGIFAVVTAVIWAVVSGVSYYIKIYGALQKSLCLGSAFAAMALACMMFWGFGADFYTSFDWAAGFGKTRRQFLKSAFALYLLAGIAFVLELRLLLEAELFLNRLIFTGENMVRPDSVYISIPWLAAFAVLVVGIAVFFGMIVHRFGGKGKVALIVLWILLCADMGGNNIVSDVLTGTVLKLSVEMQFLTAVVTGIAGMAAAALLMRNEAVRG